MQDPGQNPGATKIPLPLRAWDKNEENYKYSSILREVYSLSVTNIALTKTQQTRGEISAQCCFNVGTMSQTVGQRQSSIDTMGLSRLAGKC